MAIMSQDFNGYGSQGSSNLSDQLLNSRNRVFAGQSSGNPSDTFNPSMSSGFQQNSDSMGVIKSSDIKPKGMDFGGALGGLGSVLQAYGKGTSGSSKNTFTPQPTLNYQMQQDKGASFGGIAPQDMAKVIKRYADSLNTTMKYPSYGSK